MLQRLGFLYKVTTHHQCMLFVQFMQQKASKCSRLPVFQIQLLMKHSMVSIDCLQDKNALIFNWNLRLYHLKHSPYFRHHIAIYHNMADKVTPYINSYIRKLNNGDLFSLLYSNSELCFKYHAMREKTEKDTNLQYHYIKERAIMSGHRDRIMERIEKDSQGSTVVSIFLQHIGDREWFVQKVKERRKQGKFNCPVFFFGPFDSNKIDFHSGFHCLSTTFSPGELMSYFHCLLNSVKFEYVRLKVTCLDGTFFSKDAQSWPSPSFNQIQRKYYSPSSKYTKDELIFETTKLFRKFNLKIELFSKIFGMEQKSQSINIQMKCQSEFYQQDAEKLDKNQKCYADGKMELLNNPYESCCLVRVREGLEDAEEIT